MWEVGRKGESVTPGSADTPAVEAGGRPYRSFPRAWGLCCSEPVGQDRPACARFWRVRLGFPWLTAATLRCLLLSTWPSRGLCVRVPISLFL